MRYYEIALLEFEQEAGRPKLYDFVAIDQFVKDFNVHRRGYPGLNKRMDAFQTCREYYRPDEGVCSGSKPMEGTPGDLLVYRYHLIKGKVVVIYQYVGRQVRLVAIGPHQMYDGNAKVRLFDRIANLHPEDFKPWVNPGKVKPDPTEPNPAEVAPLTPDQRRGVVQLYTTFAIEYPAALEAIVNGDDSEFMEWARDGLGLDPDDTSLDGPIIDALGGHHQMKKHAQQWLDYREKHPQRWQDYLERRRTA